MAKASAKGKVPVWVWVAAGLVVVVGYWYGHRKGSGGAAAALEAAESGLPLQPFTQPPFADYGASPYGTGFPSWSASPTGGQGPTPAPGSGSTAPTETTTGGQRPRDPLTGYPNLEAPKPSKQQTYTVNYGTGDITLPVGYSGYVRG